MSVDRDATTTPAPDETIVRAVLHALIAQLRPVAPALPVVMVGRRSVTALPLDAMAIVPQAVIRSVKAAIRAVTAHLVVTTVALVDEDFHSAAAAAANVLPASPMIVRATTIPSFPTT